MFLAFIFLQKVIRIYIFLIIIRSLLTWIPLGDHPILGYLYRITDPFLNFFRRYVPVIGGLDFSPMVAIISLYLLEKLILNILFFLH